jgi:hypothetical protein
MRLKRYKQFNESKKDKFPNIKKMEVDGFTIHLGKDAKSNDYLTFNVATDDDLWMHVKGVRGSHVVIIVNDNMPTPEVIKKAAEIAKDNSKAKGTDNATVVYCKRRFVSKRPQVIEVEFDKPVKESLISSLPNIVSYENTFVTNWILTFDTTEDRIPILFDFVEENNLKIKIVEQIFANDGQVVVDYKNAHEVTI